MREKRLRLIITFHTTAAAMASECLCGEKGLPGRLIPVPREITAGCGMAWMADVEARERIREALDAAHIAADGYYERIV